MTDPLISVGGTADRKVFEMEMAPFMRGTRASSAIAANIAIAGQVDVPITFDKPLPTASYSPQVTLEGPSSILGGALSAIVKAGSLTTTGCVITVKNSALLALGLNVVVHVTATY